MFQSFGLYTHIRANRIKSVLILCGFVVLILVLTYALNLVYIAFVYSNRDLTIGQITSVIESAGVGLDPNAVTLTFTPASGSASTDTMTNQAASSTTWPPSGANVDGQAIKISAVYPFKTFLAVFWVGDGHAVADSGTFYLPASSTEMIQF